MKKLSILVGGLAVAGLAVIAAPANATIATFNLTTEISGATPPAGAGPNPWVQLKIDDGNSAGTIDVEIVALNLVGTEFISGFYMNFDKPGLLPSGLSIAPAGGVVPSTIPVATDDTNANAQFKADGDGFFDIRFDYNNGAFTAGLSSLFTITGAGITTDDFVAPSAPGGGNGEWFAAAHVQGIGATGNDSGWIAAGPPEVDPNIEIPEPASLGIIGMGMMAMGFVALRRRRAMI